ncbi:MAG: c-type cytochrome [Vicinamibacterales bacterium]|jgi:putative heme-binding domain-containing protein|nr:hypothetical protein [Acidobacteriota bacterium]MDP7293826.1 c-type cytochrome [Vicinamibacterales bacterium]MDP7472535.1 c-type cytochrome [Vicinamibacterales bacterium]MDP7672765.1 c-type cytochrome [Vicinamibacterales bacterium]HJO37571.1 c-type cytochrome [Vicinamibacterales bacterium]|tara:strand:- start:1642 stop:2451 length:810 start_codon:yes stop_codon:yes gene_type:complete
MIWLQGRHAGFALVAASIVLGPSPGLAVQEGENPHTSLEDVDAGQRLFGMHCSRCHGFDASGDEGPSLRRDRFRRAQSDAGLFRVISEGVPDTGMPPISRGRTDQTVWRIITFLRSINQPPESISLPGDVEAGRRVYAGRGACATCHMIAGTGRLLGPDLTTIGDRRSPAELRADLLEPDRDVALRWWSVKVTYEDGRTLEGIRMNEDTYSYRLLDADENLWSVTKRGLRERERIETSTMPSYDGDLSASELDDLIAYLFSLRTEESLP